VDPTEIGDLVDDLDVELHATHIRIHAMYRVDVFLVHLRRQVC
jgi:hypothetical protein